jgi:hypothetical protein
MLRVIKGSSGFFSDACIIRSNYTAVIMNGEREVFRSNEHNSQKDEHSF